MRCGDDTFSGVPGTSRLPHHELRWSCQINGGTEGAVGDTYVITAMLQARTYNIYTLASLGCWRNNLSASTVVRGGVITRGGTGFRERNRGN